MLKKPRPPTQMHRKQRPRALLFHIPSGKLSTELEVNIRARSIVEILHHSKIYCLIRIFFLYRLSHFLFCFFGFAITLKQANNHKFTKNFTYRKPCLSAYLPHRKLIYQLQRFTQTCISRNKHKQSCSVKLPKSMLQSGV